MVATHSNPIPLADRLSFLSVCMAVLNDNNFRALAKLVRQFEPVLIRLRDDISTAAQVERIGFAQAWIVLNRAVIVDETITLVFFNASPSALAEALVQLHNFGIVDHTTRLMVAMYPSSMYLATAFMLL